MSVYLVAKKEIIIAITLLTTIANLQIVTVLRLALVPPAHVLPDNVVLPVLNAHQAAVSTRITMRTYSTSVLVVLGLVPLLLVVVLVLLVGT